MRVILLKDVAGLAAAGAVKEVKEGYARNYLFPRRLAVQATAGNLRTLTLQKAAAVERTRRERQEAEDLARSLEQVVIEVHAKGGEGGRLFGSVTAHQIADALAARGFEISKKQVEWDEPIRSVGFHKVPVRVGPGIVVSVDVNVVVD